MTKLANVITAFMGIVSLLSPISASVPENTAYELDLECSDKTYFDDEDTLTYFYVSTDYEGETVTLVNADDMTEYTMVDDGKFSVSGDDLPYDGVYSLKMELDKSGVTYDNMKTFSFYAVTEDGSKSNTVTIKIAKRFTDTQLQEMAVVDGKIADLCSTEDYLSASYDKKVSMMYELLTELALNGTEEYPYSLIQPDSIVLSDNGFSYKFSYYFGFSGEATIEDPTQTTEPVTTFTITTTTKPSETTTVTTDTDLTQITEPVATFTTTTTAKPSETTTITSTTTPSQKFFPGDCNNDGDFNVADVVLFQKWLLTVPDANLSDWKSADFIEDDKLDIFDLCMMKHELLNNSNT